MTVNILLVEDQLRQRQKCKQITIFLLFKQNRTLQILRSVVESFKKSSPSERDAQVRELSQLTLHCVEAVIHVQYIVASRFSSSVADARYPQEQVYFRLKSNCVLEL